jgi:hypothetical protein
MRISLLFAILALILAACSSPTSSVKTVPVATSLTIGASTPQVQTAAAASSDRQSVTLTADFGSTAQRVYFVLTNESASSSTSGMPSRSGDAAPVARSVTSAPKLLVQRPRLAEAPPEFVRQANDSASARLAAGPRNRSAAGSPSFDSTPTTYTAANIGTATTTCIPAGGGTAITCTLAAYVDQSGGTQHRKLFVWVANNCFVNSSSAGTYTYTAQTTTSSIPFKVNKAQAQALADKFLGPSNDIYGFDTSIYGKEYPDADQALPYPNNDSNLITPRGEIHIFLLDLNSSVSYKGEGGVLGYFYGNDNFIKGAGGASDSNQKIMFRLDAQTFGNPTADGGLPSQQGTDVSGTPWSLTTSYWPNQLLSTLAHEFQHMIHFYEKQIVNNLSSPTATWINEMCSVVTEDFVGSQIGGLGPRGVQFTGTGTSFSYSALSGSLITFNGAGQVTSASFNDPGSRVGFFNEYYPKVSVESWGDSGSGKLANYGMAFAFGSWLARNYGGPQLFHDIVTNPYTDEQAVVSAVNAHSGGQVYTMPQLLEQFAAAMVMGSQATAAPYAMVSTDASGRFPDAAIDTDNNGGTVFQYGSIDPTTYYPYYYDASNPSNSGLDNYASNGGPQVFTSFSVPGIKSIPARAFFYYTPSGSTPPGTYTGSHTFTVVIPPHVHFDVVTVPAS